MLNQATQSQESGNPTVVEFTPAQALADFDVLRGALQEAHGGLYRFSTKSELERRFDAYRGRLDPP